MNLIICNSVISKIYFEKPLVVFEMFVNEMIQKLPFIWYITGSCTSSTNQTLIWYQESKESIQESWNQVKIPEFTLMKIQCCGPLKHTRMYMLCVYGCILS